MSTQRSILLSGKILGWTTPRYALLRAIFGNQLRCIVIDLYLVSEDLAMKTESMALTLEFPSGL